MGDAADDLTSGNQALDDEVNNYLPGEIDGPDGLEWCEFSDLLKATCSHCKDAERPKKPRPAAGGFRRAVDVMGIEATFESDCPECGDPIEVGDRIHTDADGDWIHVRCP